MFPTGEFTNPIHKLGEKPAVTRLGNLAIEARRVILLERVLSNIQPSQPDTRPDFLAKERYELEARIGGRNNYVEGGNTAVKSNVHTLNVQDNITLVDIDADGPNKGIRKIILPFVPRELTWNADSNFVGIKPMGRNNPKFHYTGSEDRLEFEIDWHSFDRNRDDVIKQCRLLEALSKGDAYNNPPHRIVIQWGNEDVLFRDMIFLVVAAPYRLTQFNRAQISKDGLLQMTAMLPKQAYQKVTLVRITSNNLSFKDITKVSSTKYY